MILQGAFYLFLFFSGFIICLIFFGDISSFLKWARHSLEENDNRASGKSLSAMALVILFISISLYVCRQGYVGAEDFKPNQKEILIVIINTIAYLVILLYGVKLLGKVKLSNIASIFSKTDKSDDGGDDDQKNSSTQSQNQPSVTTGNTADAPNANNAMPGQ